MARLTTPYATIGRKLPHSYSGLIHRKFNKYDFSLLELEPEEVRDFMLHGEYRGITITIPYKQVALEVSDVASESARRIGCANTLVRRNDGTLCADNTDYPGFLYMTRRAGISFKGAKVLILGSGGTSLTTRTVVADEGAREVVIVSRTGQVNYSNVRELHGDADIVINATPVGMYPDTAAKPLNLEEFPHLKALVDVIYNPMRTRLTQQALRLGLPVADALRMLVAQAFYAMELFLGEKQDERMIDDVTSAIRRDTANVVLIGMPGSGKTTIGKAVAEKLGREFVDMDAVVEARTGKSIQSIFAEAGEAEFRRLEAEAIVDYSKRSSLVIATGGGAVMAEENRLNLAQNSFVFLLERNLDLLEIGNGRPLSSSRDALAGLYAKRIPVYRAFADVEIDNNGLTADAVASIVEKFNECSCR